jgi:hypothetical protein
LEAEYGVWYREFVTDDGEFDFTVCSVFAWDGGYAAVLDGEENVQFEHMFQAKAWCDERVKAHAVALQKYHSEKMRRDRAKFRREHMAREYEKVAF